MQATLGLFKGLLGRVAKGYLTKVGYALGGWLARHGYTLANGLFLSGFFSGLFRFFHTLTFFAGVCFLVFKGAKTQTQLFKVNQLPVKFRPVNAGKLDFAANGNATSATHADAVNHNRVKADSGGNVKGLYRACHGFHHGHRPDGDDFFNSLIFFKAFFKRWLR